jgi:hypothetical protein
MVAYYAQRVHFSSEFFALHLRGRLFQQYIVDVVTQIEQNIINFLVLNQVQLRLEFCQWLANMVKHDVRLNPTQVG